MKKTLCILLCLMFVIPSAVALAASEPIAEVKINLTIPEAGKMVADYNPVPLTFSSTESFSLYDSMFAYLKTEGLQPGQNKFQYLPGDHVFTAGEEMFVWFDLSAKSHYRFTESTKFTVNTKNVTVFEHQVKDNGSMAFITLKFYIPGADPIVIHPDPGTDPDPQPSQPTESTEKVTLKKLKSVKLKALSAKKLEVKWKKLSKKEQSKIQKFEIQYSTDKTFKTGVKKKWAKKTKNSYTIKGLKKNTKYYVRIRAYKKSGNIIYVSKWVTKNKKTKKK